ncbi:hypothetical protein CTAYLR_000651 [Chrysophaeum taylorii]|uniref:Uncharacterized protein n=1 Tax=Chrysophaeum taylorii TaxID=2483200 RepID=A0AAD7XJ72_9STRA|nr:hypothetical protein CTAYLR_000651 [Chrysophaeum taylorii]
MGEESKGEWIEVLKVSVEPNECPLEAALRLRVEFEALRPVRGYWGISFLVDTIDKRHVVELGRTQTEDFRGRSSFEFHVEKIDVDGIEPSDLANCGLLIASLEEEKGGALAKVNMVVEVTEGPRGLSRTIYAPI